MLALEWMTSNCNHTMHSHTHTHAASTERAQQNQSIFLTGTLFPVSIRPRCPTRRTFDETSFQFNVDSETLADLVNYNNLGESLPMEGAQHAWRKITSLTSHHNCAQQFEFPLWRTRLSSIFCTSAALRCGGVYIVTKPCATAVHDAPLDISSLHCSQECLLRYRTGMHKANSSTPVSE